jgi:hypothetical protein
MFEEYQDIIIIILVIIVIYLIFDKQRENFEVTSDVRQLITTAVNNKYNIDVAAMRNMGQIANEIINNYDSLNIPATLTTINNLNAENVKIDGKLNVTQQAFLSGGVIAKGNIDVQGSLNTADLNVLGNLTVDNTKFNNLLPFNTIMLWSENLDQLPPGWAPCTGRKYKYNPNAGPNQIKFLEDPNGFQTPEIPAPTWANDATKIHINYVIRMKTQEFGI